MNQTWVGLHYIKKNETVCSDNEISGGGYKRKKIHLDNNGKAMKDVVFPKAIYSWKPITHAALWTEKEGGQVLRSGCDFGLRFYYSNYLHAGDRFIIAKGTLVIDDE